MANLLKTMKVLILTGTHWVINKWHVSGCVTLCKERRRNYLSSIKQGAKYQQNSKSATHLKCVFSQVSKGFQRKANKSTYVHMKNVEHRMKSKNLLRSSECSKMRFTPTKTKSQLTFKVQEYGLAPTEVHGKFPLISLLQE